MTFANGIRRQPLLVLAALVLLTASCRAHRPEGTNVVLVTIESLRADRLMGPAQERDPLPNLRALATSRGTIRRVLASSSETLPSLTSVFTGVSPGRHATMVEGLDRLSAAQPTLPALLARAGYRTAGFPSLAPLGLSSGLSRGFHTYGWAPSDLVSANNALAETDGKGWVASAGRRPGEATVADALNWLGRHRNQKIFLWVDLAEAAAPYATDRRLISAFPGSLYDAALAYDDRYLKVLVDGIAALGLERHTALVVAGDHGESLGAHGESLHGLNLYPPALETVVVVVPPAGAKKDGANSEGAEAKRGRLLDLFVSVLELAGVEVPGGVEARTGLPPISPEAPLLAATLGPRAAFGWNGRLALFDGAWVWSGPAEEEIYEDAGSSERTENRLATEGTRATQMRTRALALAGPLVNRLGGRTNIPSPEGRTRVLEILRGSSGAQERPAEPADTTHAREAWALDPGNFQIAGMMVGTGGAKSKEEVSELITEIRRRAPDLPEAFLTGARILEAAGDRAGALEATRRACASGGAGCVVELALRLANAGKPEEAASALAPLAESEADPDLWRALGDIDYVLQNTYRAGQAFEHAAALRPDDPDLLLRQGDCLAAVKDYKGAVAKFEQARAVTPGLKLAELRLGALAQAQGDRASAVEHFRRGLEIDSNTASGALVLGRVLAERGFMEEAMRLFLDAASRDTRSGAALFYAAETLAKAGKFKEAEEYLRQSIEREPDNPATLYLLARLLIHRGDPDEAGRALERLAGNAPPNLAMMALGDPLFSAAPPGSAVRKGLEALRVAAQKASQPDGGAPSAADPAGAPPPPAQQPAPARQ